MNETNIQPQETSNTKERVRRITALTLAAAGIALGAIPDNPAPNEAITQTHTDSSVKKAPQKQEILPGTVLDMEKGTLLVKRPNPRRSAHSEPLTQPTTVEQHPTSTTSTNDSGQGQHGESTPGHEKHHPHPIDTVIVPQITSASPSPETPAPTPTPVIVP